MQGQQPLLSIIIPTKNRYETLLPVVSAMLKNIKFEDYEIVIQDNSGDNEPSVNFFSQNRDLKLKYFYHSSDLSIRDNTIKAIDNAAGKYLIFIGDDDLVSPYIGEVTLWADEQNIKCLVHNPAYYWWNSVSFSKPTFYHKKQALWYPTVNNLLVERNSKDELERVLEQGGTHYFNLPRFYHGLVRKDVLLSIKEKTGSYLNGSSPDMAFSVSIALEIDKYYYIDYPLTVFGASKNSGGGFTASKKHFGKIEDQKHLPKNILEVWDPLIPKIWSEKTIYAQTVVEILRAFKSPKKINYENLYATMLAYEPYLFGYIWPILKKRAFKYGKGLLYVPQIFIKKKLGMFLRDFRYMTRSLNYTVEVVKDVDQVMSIMSRKNKFSKLK